ncbi:CynX/NimT family MFS transporter [Oceanicella sp. SM1341]|uniref:MFS transporter n=1 Tax=Oceanicella sp. SM1341 TaxID=1548889 RepID=UPI0018E51BBF|nr:MFS transporter [Oceanicella sp. SM1341]
MTMNMTPGRHEPVDTRRGKPALSATVVSGLPLWLGLVSVFAVGVELRPAIASIGPLLPSLSEAFDISGTQVAVLTAIPPFLMGVLALPSPWLAQRFGRNPVIIAAILLVTLATAARALIETSLMLFVTTSAVGAGIAVAGALIGGFVKSNFPQRVTLFMGLYAMSLGLGATLSAALTGPLASLADTWRVGAGVWVVPGLSAIAAWIIVSRREPARPVSAGPARRARLPLANPAAWRIAIYFAANNILFFGVLVWLVTLIIERGHDAATAGLALTTYTIAFMIANPLPGLFGHKGDRRIHIGLAALFILSGVLGLLLVPGAPPCAFVALLALGVGSSFTLGMTLPLVHTSDSEEATAWNAFVLAFGYGVGALGPLMVGLLHDRSGDMQLPLWMLAGVTLVMVLLAPFLGGADKLRSAR